MLNVRIFRTNVVSAAFFMYIRRKKAAEMTFVQKKHAKNVDEIDGRDLKILVTSFI